MSRLFQSVRMTRPKRNAFDLSHEKKMSLDMGQLIPIMLQEIVPGDNFKVNTEILLRMAPMIAPVMHRINVYTHYFFVPNRLVWTNWQDFITGGRLGVSTPYHPRVVFEESTKENFATGTLADYLGFPQGPSGTITNAQSFSALPFRAYQMIYNEYYRDQNLMAPIAFSLGDTLDSGDLDRITALRTRCWEKDYFTSCLPWSQRGGDVGIPSTLTDVTYRDPSIVRNSGPGTVNTVDQNVSVKSNGALKGDTNSAEFYIDNIEDLETTVTVNDLRRSIKLQEWLEKNARGGSRYIEQILSHFGVISSDARLQRPEYLGGGKNPVVISEVLNTAGTEGELPQGNMAGHGISVGNVNGFKKSFEEHGFVIGIMSVLPRTSYQQGIDRSWTKFDKLDYYWPEFAHLGEQEVLKKEVFYKGETADDEALFGYQSRYAEYKFKQSSVHGDFKSSLSYWHLGRIFSDTPELNDSFVSADPSTRIFATEAPAYNKLYCQLYNRVNALRPMPVFGTPML